MSKNDAAEKDTRKEIPGKDRIMKEIADALDECAADALERFHATPDDGLPQCRVYTLRSSLLVMTRTVGGRIRQRFYEPAEVDKITDPACRQQAQKAAEESKEGRSGVLPRN